MEDILKQNRMIADFMGYIHSSNPDMDNWEMSTLNYHKSWTDLMPVVDKIETLQGKDGRGWVDYVVTMDKNYCVISLGGEEIISEYQGENRIESAYNAIIKFIEYWAKEPI